MATVTTAVLAITAQSASAGVPTVGQLAAARPEGTNFSICELAIKVPLCEGIPKTVVSAMRGLPADSAGAVKVARSVGLSGDSATFAYCHGKHITGASNLDKECVFVSEFV